MDLDIDKPSALVAVVVGLAASLLVDVSIGPRTVEAQEAPRSAMAPASGPTTRAGCPVASTTATRPMPSPGPAPAGPTDRQVNSSGTGAAGAGGTIGAAPNDPCERAKPVLPRGVRPSDAASAIPGEANPARQP